MALVNEAPSLFSLSAAARVTREGVLYADPHESPAQGPGLEAAREIERSLAEAGA